MTNSYYFLWLVLIIPGVVTLVRYATGDTFYGEVIHSTGQFSTRLLIVTMAATPFRLMFPSRAWAHWLVRQRRYFGVAAFGYAALHTGVYLARAESFDDILSEAREVGLLTGWIAFAIFVPLAITSNDNSVRWLGRWWKAMHRWVYVAAAVTLAHWVLTAFDPLPGFYHLAVLVTLETTRIVLELIRGRRRTTTESPSNLRG